MTRKEIIDRLQDIGSAINNGFCFAGRHLPNFDDYREDFDDAYTNVDDLIETLKTEKNLAESGYQLVEPEYSNILTQLELWTEELAARGPRALPQVYREMARLVEPLKSFAAKEEMDPYTKRSINLYFNKDSGPDFNHQKNYE